MKNSEWVQDKEDRVVNLESVIPFIKTGTFIGTSSECEAALLNGQITEGMLVVMTKKG